MTARRAWWILLTLGVAGCQGGWPWSVVTYNAGLAVGFVEAAEDRAPVTAEATVALEADLICLQEVWEAEHVALFEDAEAFPHSHFPEPSQVVEEEPACTAEDIDPFITCMEDSCSDVCTDQLVGCMSENCALDFIRLESTCLGCVQANVGSTPAEVHATCTEGNTLYAYGGSFGTGLLSAHELSDIEELVFESTTNRRSVIRAVVDAPIGDVDVYCTHLTAVLGGIPYPREEGSWKEEMADQIGEMLDWIDQTATTDQVVLLGDMNCGPEVGGVDAKWPDNYALFDASGMTNPYVAQGGDCTMCQSNPLRGVTATESVIDHIFLDGFEDRTATTARVLTDEFDAISCEDTIPVGYSDHYGVQVTLDE